MRQRRAPDQARARHAEGRLDRDCGGGAAHVQAKLPQPETIAGCYREIAVLAFPTPSADANPKTRVRIGKIKAGRRRQADSGPFFHLAAFPVLSFARQTFPPVLRQQFQQAFRAAVNEVEQDLANVAYQHASRAVGTAGTAPFGTAGDFTDFSNTAQVLDVNGSPAGQRHMVLNAAAMNNVRGKQSILFKANEAGTDDLLRRGVVGEVEGFAFGYSPSIKSVTKGAGASYTTDTAGYAVGATAITLITGTGTVLAGDIVTFAGDSNKYVVAEGVSAPGIITLQNPGLMLAIATSATAMTIGNSFTPNLAFTDDGLLLATRMPALPVRMDGTTGDMGVHQTIVDPFSGVGFDVGMYEQYRQIRFEIGLAWGVAAPNPQHIALLLG